ncbi:MAG TPA: 16S rRNA (guanine(527)-N(7))-methyltransferase RsmG, partial [Clostridia bacterium]|nr:16S rRNA (guanine(527)-N(7))-methyltransferase RsmG [Clostridia bacterium]
AYKGPSVLEEWEAGTAAARILGGELLEAVPATVPGTDWNHLLVMARQRRPCPAQYPRKAGTPERKPLGSPGS